MNSKGLGFIVNSYNIFSYNSVFVLNQQINVFGCFNKLYRKCIVKHFKLVHIKKGKKKNRQCE